MKKRYFLLVLLVLNMSAIFSASADQIINDNLIINDSQCVGTDCVDGESFSGETLRLKENNIRIRFIDTDTLSEQDQGWEITVNSSKSGGASYFSFFNKTDGLTEPLLSDGINYFQLDCSTTPPTLVIPIVPIPAGEPALDPGTCNTIPIKVDKPALKLGAAPDGDNGTTLGYHSEYQVGVVSVGKADLLRQIKHIAAGLADTDLLIYKQMVSPAKSLEFQLDSLETQISQLEALVTEKENSTDDVDIHIKNSGSAGAMGWFSGLLVLIVGWRRRLGKKAK